MTLSLSLPSRLSYRDAVALQQSLSDQLRVEPLRRPVNLVAGTDVAYSAPTHRMYAAVVVVALPSLELVECQTTTRPATFPYIPGLFSFRELPPLAEAIARLTLEPDVWLFDGHGYSHPRRFGLACHAGVLLGRPSVGCAKSRLIGTHRPVGPARGDTADLVADEEVIGTVLRTRADVTPVFVSIGHLIDLAGAVDLVLRTTLRYRVPEPIRLAHRATTDLRRRVDPTLPQDAEHTYPDFVSE